MRLARTACQYVEEHSGKRLNENTYRYTLASFCPSIILPLRPVRDIVSIEYYDTENVQQTMTDYRFFNDEECPQLSAAEGEWPETYDRYDAVAITFISGYADTHDFPENLKQAAIMLASHWYEHRTATGLKIDDIPFGVDNLINQSKVNWFV